MHYSCTRHTNSTYVSKFQVNQFQVNAVTNSEFIRQNVFSHARVMVIGVSSDLKFSKSGDFYLNYDHDNIIYKYYFSGNFLPNTCDAVMVVIT